MELEVNNIRFSKRNYLNEKYVKFEINGYHFYAVIARLGLKDKWTLETVQHERDIYNNKDCPLCKEHVTMRCLWFEDKLEELQRCLVEHPDFRIRALFELT